MDPNAAALVMRDESADPADRLDAANNLYRWLTSGGFPQSMPGRTFGGNTAARQAALQEVARYQRALITRSRA